MVFFLLILLRVVISKKSITSKFLRKCQPLKPKNEDNFVEIEWWLFAANSALGNLSPPLFC